jgi:hypothetical protein
MGCLIRLGCLVVLCIAAAIGWFTRDRWMPERFRARLSPPPAKAATWEPLSNSGAERTRTALDKLSQPRGPVFQTLSGADVASFAFKALADRLPGAVDSIETRVVGERIAMRAVVKTSELKGMGALGALGGMLGDREHVELTGTMRVVKPGLGEFLVEDAKIRGISIPRGMIGTLVKRFDGGAGRAGASENALPLPLPQYVGDIRVANGKITLYKNVQ